MDISLQRIDAMASPEIVARGSAYFHQGRVYLDEVTDEYVRAYVDGSDEYTVELVEKRAELSVSCDCPYEYDRVCKHIVATMIAVIYHQAKLTERSASPTTTKEKQQEDSWVRQVARILPERRSPSAYFPHQKPWRLAYGLRINKERRDLYPLSIKLRKDGTDGMASIVKQYDLYDGIHFDLTDRLLVPRVTFGLSNTIHDPVGDSACNDTSYLGVGYLSKDKLMADALELLVGKELYLAEQGRLIGKRLQVMNERARLRLHLEEVDGALRMEPLIELEENSSLRVSKALVLTSDPLWVLMDEKVVQIEGGTGAELLALNSTKMPVIIPERDREEFLHEMLPRVAARYKLHSAVPSLITIDVQPRARLYLKEIDEKLAIELRFLYDTVEVPEYQHQDETGSSSALDFASANGVTCHVVRKFEDEAEFSRSLFNLSLSAMLHPSAGIIYLPTIHPLEWLRTVVPSLSEKGFEVFGQEHLKRHQLRAIRPTMAMHISSGIDWFDLSLDLKFEGSEASFQEFARAVRKNERFVRLGDGSYGVLPEQWLKKFQRTLALVSVEDDELKFSRAHLGLIDDLLLEADDVGTDALFDEMRERFRKFERIEEASPPAGFVGELRPYQRNGYDWLHFLRTFGVGGILADDMGLGKTIQALALLEKVYEDGETLPSLIIVPTSPMFNWAKEIDRFTPHLRYRLYSGSERDRENPRFGDDQVVITSYGILRNDIEMLKQQEFLYVILDESQNIKNPISVNARSARMLRARHRLALSGTPVENNLMELWSQFAFLNPGMLGGEKSFADNFARPIEKHADESASSALRRLIFPFVLRRTKELVAQELPPKIESVVYCEMDPAQRTTYNSWREYFRREIMQSIDSVGFQKSKMKVLEGLMRLRQICCHPKIVDKDYKGSAGKFDAFIEMLDDILAEGHKVLVFSQFVKMLTVLRRHCDEKSIPYEYLDGSTTNRQERVERFQNDDDVKLFLISVKAGGTGLNLTAADYVIHYDPWWNPAVEMQATDRTHRIGQTKQVFAYKLITRESVEEKILALQEKKRELVKSIITTDRGFVKSLTREDVEELFS